MRGGARSGERGSGGRGRSLLPPPPPLRAGGAGPRGCVRGERGWLPRQPGPLDGWGPSQPPPRRRRCSLAARRGRTNGALPVTVASVPSPPRVRRETEPGYPEDSGGSVLQQLPQHCALLLFALCPLPGTSEGEGCER